MCLYDLRLMFCQKLLQLREYSQIESTLLRNDANPKTSVSGSVDERTRGGRFRMASAHESENVNIHEVPVFAGKPDQVLRGPRNGGGLQQCGDADWVSRHCQACFSSQALN